VGRRWRRVGTKLLASVNSQTWTCQAKTTTTTAKEKKWGKNKIKRGNMPLGYA